MGQSLYISTPHNINEVILMKAKELALREKIVSLHKKNKPTREIAYLLDISKSKAAFWVKRYKDTGKITNLPRSGRPTKLTKKKLSNIRDTIKQYLVSNKNKAGISSKEVKKLIEEETGRAYTLRHIQRILHKIGLSLVTPRVGHIKKDKKAQEKFKREFKKNLSRNMWAIQL